MIAIAICVCVFAFVETFDFSTMKIFDFYRVIFISFLFLCKNVEFDIFKAAASHGTFIWFNLFFLLIQYYRLE